jgi:hypothetical protein
VAGEGGGDETGRGRHRVSDQNRESEAGRSPG